MISEIFDLLSSMDVEAKDGKRSIGIRNNARRIRSISAFSSNSIFYFPVIVSDQLMPEEVSMTVKMLEKSYASFVVACISLMPFHRVKSDDRASVEDYLSQFHQNIGMTKVNSEAIFNVASNFGLTENATDDEAVKATQDFLYECWMRSLKENSDFVKLVCETVSLNDMYSVDPIDPKTRVLQEQFKKVNDELETWGFIGEATDDMYDDDDEDDLDADDIWNDEDYDEDDDIDEDEYDDSILDEKAKLHGKVKSKGFVFRSKHLDVAHHTDKITATISSVGGMMESTGKKVLNDKGEVVPECCEECGSPVKLYLKGEPVFLCSNEECNKYYGVAPANMNEAGNVKTAINGIKFALESVSDNKIMSCPSLTKLNKLESKLKGLKTKYTKYLNRYKKKYKENQKSGSKSKLAIRFNNMCISNPKLFMQQYGKYIKVINKKLKLVDKRRAELHQRRGTTAPTKIEESTTITLSDLDLESLDYCNETVQSWLDAPDNEVFYIVEAPSNYYTPQEIEAMSPEERASVYAGQQAALDMREEELRNTARDLNKANNRNAGLMRELDKHTEKSKAFDRTMQVNRNLQAKNKALNKQNVDLQKQLTTANSRLQNTQTSTQRTGKTFTGMNTFDREVFTNMEMKKVNEAVPTFAKASIGFVVDETDEVISRDVLVGIKCYIHKAPAMELISDVYNCIINKRKFLKFVKFISGEERSLSDLVFGIKELKRDAIDSNKSAGQWRSAFKRRQRWSKISIPYLMKEYTPNGTVVLTMNEVDFIKNEYGIDVMDPDHVKMIMDSDFLLGLVIIDQANEIVNVTYDGHGYGFQQYTYAMLEREQQNSDRMMRELYRSFSRS